MAKKKKKTRSDGWSNLLSGEGTRADPRTSMKPGTSVYDRQMLEDMFRDDGLARRIVETPAKEMTRKGFVVHTPEDEKLQSYMEGFDLEQGLFETLLWARLYGGAVGLIGVNDGQNLEAPVNEQGIKAVEFLRAYDRHQVTFTTSDLYDDPRDRRFGLPRLYTIQPIRGGSFRVHESRLIRIEGATVSNRARAMHQDWAESELAAAYESVRALASTYAGVEIIVRDFVQAVLSINGLQEMIASGREELVRQRLNLLDLSRHVLNTMIIDAEGETYSKQASTVAGLSDVLDRFILRLSAASGIPVTVLMGQAPAGLAATGDADVRNWYDKLASDQKLKLRKPVDRIVWYSMLASDSPVPTPPKEWRVEFHPLWQLTEIEESNIKYQTAQSDEIWIRNGVLDPDEVAVSRFGGCRFSVETTIDPGNRGEPEPAETQEPEENDEE